MRGLGGPKEQGDPASAGERKRDASPAPGGSSRKARELLGRARQQFGTLGRRMAPQPPQLSPQVPPRNAPQEGDPLWFSADVELRETIPPGESSPMSNQVDENRVRTPRPGLAGRLMRVVAQKSDLSDGINAALLEHDVAAFTSQLPRVSPEELTATLQSLEMWERQSLYEQVSLVPADQHTANALRILLDITNPSAALLPELGEALAVVMENHAQQSLPLLYKKVRGEIALKLPEGHTPQDIDFVVTTIIGGLLKRNPQSHGIIEGFLQALPPQELTGMLRITREQARQADYKGFHDLAKHCIDVQREAALRGFVPTAGFLNSLGRNPATGRLNNQLAFANAVIAGDKNRSLYGTCGGDQDLTPYLDDIRGELTPLSLPANLENLDVPTLVQLGEAVKRFGDDGAWSATTGKAIADAIDQAIPLRKQKDIDAHKAIAKSVVAAVRQGDATVGAGVVRAIKAAISDHLNSPAGPGGERSVDRTVTALIGELTVLVAEMSAADRLGIARALNSPALRELRGAIRMLALIPPDAQSRPVFAELHQIDAILDAVSKAAGAEGPPTIESFDSLPDGVRNALGVCGIGVGGKGVVYFSADLRHAVEQCLTVPPIAPASLRGVLHVPTTTYSIVGLHSGPALADVRERLNVLCRDDPHLSQALRAPDFFAKLQGATSQVMHAMAQALASSGVRKLDGTPIDLHGDLAAGFSFEFHPKHGLVVKCTLLLSGPFGLTGDPEDPDLIRLGGDARIALDFAMGPDGVARMMRPPVFTNNIQAVPSWAEDLKPRGVNDLMQPGAPAAIRQAYNAYVVEKLSPEAYEFIEAVDALPQDDAEALHEVRRPGGIAETFIRDSSVEKFVNVADALIQHVMAAINDPNADMQTIRSRLRELRAAAVELTNRDTFQRFVREKALAEATELAAKEMPVKEESPRNVKVKEGGVFRVLVPSEVAQRQAKLARKRPADINSSLRKLASLSATKEAVDRNATTLLAQKGDPFANTQEFQAHVSAFLIAHIQDPFALASLRYNLERAVADEMRGDPRIVAALAATKDAQARSAGAGFGLMSPETILLQHAPPGLHSKYLALWFKDNRVSEVSIAEFFKKIPDPGKLQAKLNAIDALTDVRQDARNKLVEIGQRELAARGARTQTVPRIAPRPPRRAMQDPDWFNKSGDVLRQGADIWLLNKRLPGSNLLPDDLPILGALASKLDTEDLGTRSNEIREMVRGLATIKSTEWEPLQEAWLSELLDVFVPPPSPPQPLSPAEAGADFIRIVEGWDFQAALLPQHAQALASLATRFEELKPRRTPQGLTFASDAPPGTVDAYVLLHARLEAQLDEFRGEGWQPEDSGQLASVQSSLETLMVDTRAVQLVHRAFTAPAST